MGTRKGAEIRLKSRPTGMPDKANFDLVTVDVPDPGPGQSVLATAWSADGRTRGPR